MGKRLQSCVSGRPENTDLKAASIQASDIDGRPCRAAGRGGLGAVMGAKGLKALVVDQRGNSPDVLADPEAFKEAAKAYAKAIKDHPFSGQVVAKSGDGRIGGYR